MTVNKTHGVNGMNTAADFFCLHDGKTYHCSEVTTEAYLNCAETCYGHGATLFMLDELEGGQYVKAEDCLKLPTPIPASPRSCHKNTLSPDRIKGGRK